MNLQSMKSTVNLQCFFLDSAVDLRRNAEISNRVCS